MGVEEHKPCHHIHTQMRGMVPPEKTEQLKKEAEKARLKTKQQWTAHCDGSKPHKTVKRKQKLILGKERTGFLLKKSETRHHFEQSP